MAFSKTVYNNFWISLEYLWYLSRSVRLYKVDATIVVGKEKYTGETIRTFYIGRNLTYKLIFDYMYSDFVITEKHRNINSLNTMKWIRKYHDTVDLIFADVEMLFCKILPRREFIEIPQWVIQRFEVPHSREAVLGSFRKSTRKELRRLLKRGFTYKIVRSNEEFEKFYRTMYLPYITEKFGSLAIIDSERQFHRTCRGGGELLVLSRDEKVLLGVLLRNLSGRLASELIGVSDNVEPEMMQGIFDVSDYFTILHGYELGCHTIDFGPSRTLLNDGVFRYKRKWGTYLQKPSYPLGDIILKPLNFKAAVRSFFVHNPFIARDGKKLVGKILFDKPKVSKIDIERCLKYYFTEGLDCLKIFSLLGFEEGTKKWADTTHKAIRLHDLSHSPSSAEDFCRL